MSLLTEGNLYCVRGMMYSFIATKFIATWYLILMAHIPIKENICKILEVRLGNLILHLKHINLDFIPSKSMYNANIFAHKSSSLWKIIFVMKSS